MLVNKKIKEILKEISEQSVKYHNSLDQDRKYHKRLLKFYKEKLTEDEQLFILRSLLESLNYKNIVTDPDNVLTLHSIRLRNITYTFLLVCFSIVLAAALFRTNETLNNLIEIMTNGLKLLSI